MWCNQQHNFLHKSLFSNQDQAKYTVSCYWMMIPKAGLTRSLPVSDPLLGKSLSGKSIDFRSQKLLAHDTEWKVDAREQQYEFK